MPDYTPVYLGHEITLVASTTITGGQLVVITGSGTVGPAGANTAGHIGVAGHDATAGQRLMVTGTGLVHESVASGAITAGQDLVSAATGAVAARGSGVNRVGLALTSATNGNLVRWIEEADGAPKATTATAGTPGTFTPSGSYTPFAFADLAGVTASPGTAWTTGQRVVLGDGSNAHWNGTAWVVGTAP